VIIELIEEKRYETGSISIITLIELLRGVQERKRVDVMQLIEKSFEVKNIDNKINLL